jgi:RND family efflux transporter MFP subunit
MEKKLGVIMGAVFGGALILCALVFASYYIWTSNILGSDKTRQIPEVTVLTANYANIQPRVQIHPSAILNVGSVDQKNVYAQVDGKIGDILVKQGEIVAKGQLIATVDIQDLQEKVTEAEAKLNMARVQMNQATSDALRYEELYRKNATSKALFEQYAAQQKISVDGMRIAQAQYDNLKDKASKAGIYAPIGGRLVQSYGQIGKSVVSGDILAVVGNYFHIQLQVRVEKQVLKYAQAGSEVKLQALLPQMKDRVFDGKVMKVTPDVNFSSGGYLLIQIADTTIDIVNQFNQGLELTLPVNPTALMLPNTACEYVKGKYYIYVVDESSTVHKREVEVKSFSSDQDKVEVFSNLSVGEIVVEKGLYNLRDGQQVRVR